ncbi:HprK-related kinase A [Propionivibrio sp.]|uniref:HprK-related kinase A n=1 Tax=Propionivibrio sp. TaxID=2212460 RepID=UPI0039E30514
MALLRRGELLLDLKPFVVRVRSDIESVARDIGLMYAQFDIRAVDSFADFHVAVLYDSGVFGRIRARARFFFDGRPSFIPLPANQAFAMLEWGLNWCVAAHSHQYLIIHAAVVERGGRAAVLPGPPGAGKSTLCAALVTRGWRLLSDELALLDMDTNLLYGMCRPVNLKNASIGIIQRFAPEVVMTRPVSDTSKGTIALMRPPAGSVGMVERPARPAWVVVPRYSAESSPLLEAHRKAETFMLLAQQSFNYDIHGTHGFSAVGRLIDACRCLRFTYSDLDDAVRAFDALQAEGAE